MFLFAANYPLCDVELKGAGNFLRFMRKLINNFLERKQWGRGKVPAYLKKALSKNHACYILITCDKPSADGNMQVEMSYEGDAYLAAYLIENAQGVIDDEIRL